MEENALLKAVLDDLKAEGSAPATTSRRRCVELGERLRAVTGLPLTRILGTPWDLQELLRVQPREAEGRWARGAAAARRGGVRGVRQVRLPGRARPAAPRRRPRLREGRAPADARARARRQEAAAPQVEQLRRRGVARAAEPAAARGRHPRLLVRPPQRAVGHRHHGVQAALRGEVLPVARHRLLRRKAGGLVDLDAPDGGPRNSSLEAAYAALAPGETPAVHSDRGGHYRWSGWIAICERRGLARSMSRKGTSGDNARAEGFFGLLKQEFFYSKGWKGVGAGEFMAELDAWMRWFRSGRISQALGWLTPDEHRLALGYAV